MLIIIPNIRMMVFVILELAITMLWDKGNNNFEIVNQGSAKVTSYASKYQNGSWYQAYVNVNPNNSNPSDNDRLFTIPAASSTFSLPTLPATGTRTDAPNYTGSYDRQLPLTSNYVAVGASLIPCFMVKNSQATDYTKIKNSPYYTLVKEGNTKEKISCKNKKTLCI